MFLCMIYVIMFLFVFSLLIVGSDQCFLVCCIFCIGCNYVDYVCEMGVVVEKDMLLFFCKFVDVLVIDGVDVFYLQVIVDLYYEVEMVVVLGVGGYDLLLEVVVVLVWGYGVGLDFICCDLQVVVKVKSYLWDVVKVFDYFVLMLVLVLVIVVMVDVNIVLQLDVNGEWCQYIMLGEMVYSVLEIFVVLLWLFELKVGDLVFIGILVGVVVLQCGDCFYVELVGVVILDGCVV